MLELENPELDQQSYLEAFRAFDNTGKGYVNSSLIREILVDVMGDRKKDRDYILQIFQLDKDRKVSYDGKKETNFRQLNGDSHSIAVEAMYLVHNHNHSQRH